MADSNHFTIDELAHDAGLPVSTIRMYQQRGLTDPPKKRGRVGYYGETHRDRLRLIAQLQDRGFSLAAIKEAVDSWNSGQSLDQLLGLNDTPGLAHAPLRLSLSELGERFAGLDISQADMQKAAKIGLIEVDGTDVVISNSSFADLGPAVGKLGVPVSEMLEEYEALQEAVEGIAERFRAVFEKRIWDLYVEEGMSAAGVPGLTDAATKLAGLATELVTTELNAQFADFVQGYIAQAME